MLNWVRIKQSAYALLTVCMLVGCGGEDNTPHVIVEPPATVERAGHSVARLWNELVLHAIRNDFARPTVHARNLFHISSAMYDAWSIYQPNTTSYLFGKTVGDFSCPALSLPLPDDALPLQEKAISFATYRLIAHRFRLSPGDESIMAKADNLMEALHYDASDKSLDYSQGSAAALGNYIGDCYIRFGLQDGANEQAQYANKHYTPLNPSLALGTDKPGNPNIVDLNRWQPLLIEGFIDQAGNLLDTPPTFLSPEWGQVVPFALSENDKTVSRRDGVDYQLYHDPGMPPLIDNDFAAHYKWAFALVAIWSSHLHPNDDVVWDISPNSIGNIGELPTDVTAYPGFYDLILGGDTSKGYPLNPVTKQPYVKQLVPRGDYTRVLAEFWADGPDSETPPGHWFVILNTISDHPLLEKRWAGAGALLGKLEWDVKTYFALGGAMHDAAIAAWGIKGRYDYIRPVSAIRAMADLGQSSDKTLPSYHPNGIPLVANYIEVVTPLDPLAGDQEQHVGKIKLYSWQGPDYIDNPLTDQASVGWILAENWWPYQRPSFVTPPFAGYVSGHSTFSRAAAELLTLITGSAYFPGGMSEFKLKANQFLRFEQGPSIDMTLQWATYKDAADQCSLSRIWGGIHPPSDDIPGRIIGEKIGKEAFNFVQGFVAP